MSTRTDTVALYERLRDEGLFEETAETIRLSDAFVAARRRERERLSELDEDAYADVHETYAAGVDVDVDERTLADAIAIRETCETVDRVTSVHVACSLGHEGLGSTDPHVPDGFVPLSGDKLGQFMNAHTAAIVYCWRENCDPCDAVRADLETLEEDGTIPESVGLGAVYGPDNVDVLRERYEVGAAPTVLFCADGHIDSRFVGNPGQGALRKEIRLLVPQS